MTIAENLFSIPTRRPLDMFRSTTAPAMASNTAMSAASQSVAIIGHFWHKGGPGTTKTVQEIEWRHAATMTFNGSTIRASIQGVATASGPPARADGTIKGATNSAYADYTSGSASTWESTSGVLTESCDLTFGDLIAVVFAVQAGTPTSVGISGISSMGAGAGSGHRPSVVRFDGVSTYAVQTMTANMALRCSDGSYATVLGAYPCSALNTLTYQASSNPDEYGAYWVPNHPFRADAIGGALNQADANADGTFTLSTNPTTGVGVVDTASILAEQGDASGGPRIIDVPFTTARDLAAGTPIGVAFRNTGTGNTTTYSLTIPSSTIRDDLLGGVRMIERDGGSGNYSESSSGLRLPFQFHVNVRGYDAGGSSQPFGGSVM